MRNDKRAATAYALHSTFAPDKKERVSGGIMENMEEDLHYLQSTVQNFSEKKFDFCASCLLNHVPVLRVFDSTHVFRFGVDTSRISLDTLRTRLVESGWTYMTTSKKSGPLKLTDEGFNETYSVALFRVREPFVDIFRYFRIYFGI